jgi:hypothetical protein
MDGSFDIPIAWDVLLQMASADAVGGYEINGEMVATPDVMTISGMDDVGAYFEELGAAPTMAAFSDIARKVQIGRGAKGIPGAVGRIVANVKKAGAGINHALDKIEAAHAVAPVLLCPVAFPQLDPGESATFEISPGVDLGDWVYCGMFARSAVGLATGFSSLKFRGEEQIRGSVVTVPAAGKARVAPFEMFGAVMNSYKGEKYHKPYVGSDFAQTDKLTGTIVNNTAVGDTDETIITPDFVVLFQAWPCDPKQNQVRQQSTRRALSRVVRSNPLRLT